jgi:hypothetical protein
MQVPSNRISLSSFSWVALVSSTIRVGNVGRSPAARTFTLGHERFFERGDAPQRRSVYFLEHQFAKSGHREVLVTRYLVWVKRKISADVPASAVR